jgi:hypothetical protein
MAYALSPDLASFPNTTPTFDWQLKFRNESIRERRCNKSSKTDRVIMGTHFQTRTSRDRDHSPTVGPHDSIGFW